MDRGSRTPQIGDEVAATGPGGVVWWGGRIIAMQPPGPRGGAAKTPTYTVEIFFGAGSSKTGCKLSTKTYGPAQCKVENFRAGGAHAQRGHAAVWVFLVPLAQ